MELTELVYWQISKWVLTSAASSRILC